MRILVFGSGYVGLVTAACLADVGHVVSCVDIDQNKVERLNRGQVPIFEPGLADLVKRNAEAGRLLFTTDGSIAVKGTELVFIAVGTPPTEDGSADLRQVLDVARTIGAHLEEY